jgi:phage tail tube protein FII
MQPLYLLTAVDVRRAEQAGSSRAVSNIISKLTIPAIKFKTADHNPGGGVMGVAFTLPRIEPIEPAMQVKGFDVDIFGDLGQVGKWTFAGALKDKKTGKDTPCRAIIEGAIVEWTPDDGDPEAFLGCNHAFKEVTHYEFSIDGTELWYADFWERVVRLKGTDMFAGVRTALGA